MDAMARLRGGSRLGLLVVGMIVVALLVAACSGSDDENRDGIAGLGGLTGAETAALLSSSGAFGFSNSGTGIRANGVGVVEARPDIAVLSVGVETFALTVAAARDEAATAMDGMLSALGAANVPVEDISTRFFNIQPEYTFEEVIFTPDGGERIRRSERKLVGYRVTNTLSVTLRDLDAVGGIIDDVVTAGGDAARIDNISFTIEDGTALEEQARTLAVQDAVAKADLYAAGTGVERGKLVFISETSALRFPTSVRAESFDGAALSAAPPTQILAGELEVRVSVQAVFDIN